MSRVTARKFWDRCADKRCWYCGVDIARDEATVDHKIPQCDGGKGGENLALACRRCNLRKGHMTLEDFRTACMVRWSPYGEIITVGQALQLLAAGASLPALKPVTFHGEVAS